MPPPWRLILISPFGSGSPMGTAPANYSHKIGPNFGRFFDRCVRAPWPMRYVPCLHPAEPKGMHARKRPRHHAGVAENGPVVEYLAKGDFDLGIQQTNIIVGVPGGSEYVGPLPDFLNDPCRSSVALLTVSKEPGSGSAMMPLTELRTTTCCHCGGASSGPVTKFAFRRLPGRWFVQEPENDARLATIVAQIAA
jgi:hypothetical protein